jgi:hypothetical protein
MFEACPNCKLKYERAPGYFLGSTYINYGVTAVVITVLYITLHFGYEFDNRMLTGPMVLFFIGFPLFFFRYARSLWLALDSLLDPEESESD